MLVLKEFADIITYNKATLAATYARLLEEIGNGYEDFSNDRRVVSARKLLTAVIEACESETTGPLCDLFRGQENENKLRWDKATKLPDPTLEIDCLGQTLFPVVTNLEAGKFLWHLLAEARRQVYQGPKSTPAVAKNQAQRRDVETEAITERKWVEESLKKRAHQLETVIQVSTAISTILDSEQLLQTVVDLTKKRFGLYHAHIYLLNGAKDTLILTAGAAEVGRKLVSEGWNISLDKELSLVAQAARTRQVVVVNDVQTNKGFLSNPLLPKTRSEMAVPIIIGAEEVLGVLDVQSDELDYFTDEDVRVQTALAAQIATTVRNARLFENLGRAQKEAQLRLRDTESLQTLSLALSGALHIDDIASAFFEACTKLNGVDYAIFSLIDDDQQRVKAVAGFNVSEDHLQRANHPLDSDAIMADIVRTGQTEIIAGWDARIDPKDSGAEGQAEWGLRIFTPITLRQINIGLVEVGFNKNIGAAVQDSQVRLLRTFIDQTALALESARRYEASQRLAHREQTIREITDQLRAATSLEMLLETAARELGQRLGIRHTVLELGIEPDSEAGQGLPGDLRLTADNQQVRDRRRSD